MVLGFQFRAVSAGGRGAQQKGYGCVVSVEIPVVLMCGVGLCHRKRCVIVWVDDGGAVKNGSGYPIFVVSCHQGFGRLGVGGVEVEGCCCAISTSKACSSVVGAHQRWQSGVLRDGMVAEDL